jgi:predicted alpha-1,6-mannanase (GH76 family)
MISDHCLLIGYADQRPEIDADIVKRAVAYLEQGESDGGGSVLVQSSRLRIRRFSRRVVMAWSACAVAAAAATTGIVSPATYGSFTNAMSTVMVASMGGIVRWLTTWWGS